MKLPVHIWAMLSHGREAESCNVSEWPEAHGFRMRWREYDGERGWTLPDRKGYTPDRFWQESLVQRIMWTKRDGQWYGEWTNWEIYIPDGYDGWRGRDNRWQRDRRRLLNNGGTIPQEILLLMVRQLYWGISWDSHSNLSELRDPALTCRAWLDICAPALYRMIHLHPHRLPELIAVLSKPRSRLAQHAQWLSIHGPVPWLALPTLMKQLLRVEHLRIQPVHRWDEVPRPYHPSHPQMCYSMLASSRTALTLTELHLESLEFSSPTDVLKLLALFPQLLETSLRACTIPPAERGVPAPSSTHLRTLSCEIARYYRQVADVASLAHWWRWPHSLNDSYVGLYPGLHQADVQGVFTLVKLLQKMGLPEEP